MRHRLICLAGLTACVEYTVSNKTDPAAPGTTCDDTVPPELLSHTPGAEAILSGDGAVSLAAQVADPDTPAGALWVRWWDSAGDLIDEQRPDSSGLATGQWGGGRLDGAQVLSVEVEDDCGNVATSEVGVCQQQHYEAEGLALSSWQLAGSATLVGSDEVELTTTGTDETGSAFLTSEVVQADAVNIAFEVLMEGGTGADGISLTALHADSDHTLGGSGCGLGYGGDADCTDGPALPGWSIELDTWFNSELPDPTVYDHVAMSFDGQIAAPVAWERIPELEDTGWHRVEIRVDAPRVLVAIDGLIYLDAEVDGDFAFPAVIGFTAATGGQTNRHRIRGLAVTETACPTGDGEDDFPQAYGSVGDLPDATLDVTAEVTSDWGDGYCTDVTVSNPSDEDVYWETTLDADGTIDNLWNATVSESGGAWLFRGADWNATVHAGGAAQFGFCASR